MNKWSLKNIVATIKKEALDPSDFLPPPSYIKPGKKEPETVNNPTKGTGTTLTGHVNTGVSGSLPSVVKMQTALQNLSNQIQTHNIPVNFPKELLQSLEQIKELPSFSDGAWGPITDKALHQVLDFAKLLVSLPEKFGVANEVYSANNLERLEADLSGYQVEGHHITLDQEEQIKRADFITEHLEAITKLYLLLLEKIPTISNEQSFNTKEQEAIQTGNTFVEYKGQTLTIPLSSLTSPTKYNQLIQSLQLDDVAKMEILEKIINQAARAI
jgi:hypothetical protein